MQKKIIKLPEGLNPNSLLTFKEASEISGIPIRMLYHYRQEKRRGMQVYKIGRRVFVAAGQFVRWANAQIRTA